MASRQFKGSRWFADQLAALRVWLRTLPSPTVKQLPVQIGFVPVHWVAPVRIKAWHQVPAIQAVVGRTNTTFSAVSGLPVMLGLSTTTAAAPVALVTDTKPFPVGAKWKPKAYSQIVQWTNASHRNRLADLRTTIHSCAMALPAPRQKTLRWQPPPIPVGRTYPVAATFRIRPHTLPVVIVSPKIGQYTDKARWLLLERLPIPAHRFALRVRDGFRKMLAASANTTDPNQILLRTVVDRVPVGRISQVQSRDDGGIRYQLNPGPDAGLESVVTGRHLTTRQALLALVPPPERLAE